MRTFALPLLLVLPLAACSKKDDAPKPAATTATATETAGGAIAAVASSARAHGHEIPGVTAPAAHPLTWTAPPTWQAQGHATPTRTEYLVPHAPGEADDAKCLVTTFGKGQGGTVEMNVDRWIKQFDPVGSKLLSKATSEADGMKVTTVEIIGTYKPMAVPNGPVPAPQPNSRMIAAVVEAPDALWFFKLTGPEDTVREESDAFKAMIGSIKRGK